MNENEMHQAIDAIACKMVEKGLVKPQATIMINANEYDVTAYMHWDDDSLYGRTEIYRKSSVEGALAKSHAFLDALPSAEDAKRHAFIRAVDKAMVIGREAGLDDVYISPLLEMIRALSSNAIEYAWTEKNDQVEGE